MGELGQSSSEQHSRTISPARIFTLAVVVIAGVLWPFSNPYPHDYVGLGFTFSSLSIASMTGIWCAVTKPWSRYFVALLVTLANGLAITFGATPFFNLLLLSIPFLIAISIALTLEFIKLCFGEFTQSIPADEEFQEGLQFRISHLLIVTTLVAALCAIGKALAPTLFALLNNQTGSVATIVSVLAFNTLISTWALLGVNVRGRVLISALTAGLVIFLGSYFSPSGLSEIWAAMFTVVWTVNTVLLVLLRREGYRFVRRSKKPAMAKS